MAKPIMLLSITCKDYRQSQHNAMSIEIMQKSVNFYKRNLSTMYDKPMDLTKMT